jgi:hypothetical protein
MLDDVLLEKAQEGEEVKILAQKTADVVFLTVIYSQEEMKSASEE